MGVGSSLEALSTLKDYGANLEESLEVGAAEVDTQEDAAASATIVGAAEIESHLHVAASNLAGDAAECNVAADAVDKSRVAVSYTSSNADVAALGSKFNVAAAANLASVQLANLSVHAVSTAEVLHASKT